ncbi:MAG: RidA family protein [Pseudomonadota bacterium]
MKREPINPDSLFSVEGAGLSHAIFSQGKKTLHISGQVAMDAEGKIVGAGDLAAQTNQALKNLGNILASVKASPENLVQIRTYVVNYSPEQFPTILSAIIPFYGGATPAAHTLVGVSSLAVPDLLIEIEGIAVLD